MTSGGGRGGKVKIIFLRQGGVSQKVILNDKWGGGSRSPFEKDDIICEQHLKVILKNLFKQPVFLIVLYQFTFVMRWQPIMAWVLIGPALRFIHSSKCLVVIICQSHIRKGVRHL